MIYKTFLKNKNFFFKHRNAGTNTFLFLFFHQKYNAAVDDKDITTKFQMSTRGKDVSVRAFISKTGVPIYFDTEGNYRPEGPSRDLNSDAESDSELHPLYFITSNVKVLKVTQV